MVSRPEDSLTQPQAMQEDPVDFLFTLAEHIQVLVCISWLGKTQVLACIPPSDQVAFEDIAETTGVSVNKLTRIVRLVSTIGFLNEPQPGLVAHTILSLQFFERPVFMDAALFISDTMMPAALRMCEDDKTKQSKGVIAPVLDLQPYLRRQMEAFHRLELGRLQCGILDSLLSLDWQNLDHGTVVQIGPPSTAIAMLLSERAPRLKFIVQLKRPSTQPYIDVGVGSRIELSHREECQGQNITNADVYILHLPSDLMISNTPSSKMNVVFELQVHFNLLRSNHKASLIIVAPVLPNAGGRNTKAESTTRLHDLKLLQLADEGTMDMKELERLINSVGDKNGYLAIKSEVWSTSSHYTVTILSTHIQAK